MSVYSAQYHAMIPSPVSEQVTVTAVKGTDQEPQEPKGESFFHRLLDVINPLQHLPLVGTAYRAITGDHMGPVEKVMGDTLYGGLWGAVTSIADVAFEGITGKSVEDTVLGWFSHDHAKLASAKIAAPKISASTSLPSAELPSLPGMELAAAVPDSLDLASFSNALATKGVNGEMAQRAMYAYRRSMGLIAPSQPVLSSIN
jgi:hypothetical protein